MSKFYISDRVVENIRALYDPKLTDKNITNWTYENYGVRFDGMSRSMGEGYYLEGPDELITWFLIRVG